MHNRKQRWTDAPDGFCILVGLAPDDRLMSLSAATLRHNEDHLHGARGLVTFVSLLLLIITTSLYGQRPTRRSSVQGAAARNGHRWRIIVIPFLHQVKCSYEYMTGRRRSGEDALITQDSLRERSGRVFIFGWTKRQAVQQAGPPSGLSTVLNWWRISSATNWSPRSERWRPDRRCLI